MITQRQFRMHGLGVLACALVAAGVFLYFLSLSGVSLLGGRAFTFRAAVPSAVSLAPDADVREAGVRIGSVRHIATVGDHAVLTLSIASRYGPVYRDAQVQVRAKTLAGENFVALTVGSPAAGRLAAGALLPLTDAVPSVQLDQILSTFSAPRRQDVQRILDVLGTGLGNHGDQLNGLLEGSSDLLDDAYPTSTVLAQDRQQLAGLIQDFGTVADALGSRRQGIETFVRTVKTEAQAVSSRDARLRALLAVLPSVLTVSRSAVGHLGTFAVAATPVMGDLRVATDDLVPAMATLGPASAAARRTLSALGRFAPVAAVSARTLRAFAPRAVALLPAFEGALRQLNPMLVYLVPYTTTLGALYSNLSAGSIPRSAISYFGRLNDNFDLASLAGELTPAQHDALQAILDSGLISSAEGLHSNAYPAPGTIAHPSPFTGTYPRIQADPPYGPSTTHTKRRIR